MTYGFATQVCLLDERGRLERVVAAHDVGKIINRHMVEGQIEGAVHMGLGYALTEELPLVNRRAGVIQAPFSRPPARPRHARSDRHPRGIERSGGPFGAKGVAKSASCPRGAIANALYRFDARGGTRCL